MSQILGSAGTSPSPTDGKGAVAPSREPSATVTTSPATCYTVRNGWAWAHIFVRHGVARDRPSGGARHWVHVSILSDFGEFGYCWTHIGEDWRKFLTSLSFGYAMNKMFGSRFHVPMSIDEAEEKGRKTIILYRREGSLDREDARKLWDGINDADRDGDLDGFLRDWDRCSDGVWYAHDFWDMGWDRVNPQAEGFWREIWPHFCAVLVAPEARSTSPSRLSAEGVRDAGEASGQPTEPEGQQ